MRDGDTHARRADTRPRPDEPPARRAGGIAVPRLCERQVLRMVHNGQIPAKKFGHNWYYSPGKNAQLVGMLDQ